jgi:hypothetical protein
MSTADGRATLEEAEAETAAVPAGAADVAATTAGSTAATAALPPVALALRKESASCLPAAGAPPRLNESDSTPSAAAGSPSASMPLPLLLRPGATMRGSDEGVAAGRANLTDFDFLGGEPGGGPGMGGGDGRPPAAAEQ